MSCLVARRTNHLRNQLKKHLSQCSLQVVMAPVHVVVFSGAYGTASDYDEIAAAIRASLPESAVVASSFFMSYVIVCTRTQFTLGIES